METQIAQLQEAVKLLEQRVNELEKDLLELVSMGSIGDTHFPLTCASLKEKYTIKQKKEK